MFPLSFLGQQVPDPSRREYNNGKPCWTGPRHSLGGTLARLTLCRSSRSTLNKNRRTRVKLDDISKKCFRRLLKFIESCNIACNGCKILTRPVAKTNVVNGSTDSLRTPRLRLVGPGSFVGNNIAVFRSPREVGPSSRPYYRRRHRGRNRLDRADPFSKSVNVTYYLSDGPNVLRRRPLCRPASSDGPVNYCGEVTRAPASLNKTFIRRYLRARCISARVNPPAPPDPPLRYRRVFRRPDQSYRRWWDDGDDGDNNINSNIINSLLVCACRQTILLSYYLK